MAESRRAAFPKITHPRVVILEAERTTGIVLTLEGKWFTGDGETYRVFSSLAEAEKFAIEAVRLRPSSEFNILDSKEELIKCISRK